MEVDEAESQFRRGVALAGFKKRKLARLVGPDGVFEEPLVMDADLLVVPASAPAEAELLERALTLRADLEVIHVACKEYELEEKLANNKRYPSVIFVQVSHRVTYLPERGAWGWNFGVDLPFFRSAAGAEVKLAAQQGWRVPCVYVSHYAVGRMDFGVEHCGKHIIRSDLPNPAVQRMHDIRER